MLDRDDPRPPYVQIAEHLAAKIAAGDYSPGERLPGKPTLVARFAVAGATINRAIDVLKRDGLVVGRQGQGTFVVATPKAPEATRLDRLEARVVDLERRLEALTTGSV
jgi:DNA-binding GntR family transcriptional regulator